MGTPRDEPVNLCLLFFTKNTGEITCAFRHFPGFRQQFAAPGSAIRSLCLDCLQQRMRLWGCVYMYMHTGIYTPTQSTWVWENTLLLTASYQAVFKLNNWRSVGNKAFVAVSGGYLPSGNSCHLVQSGACQWDTHSCIHDLVDRFYFTSKLYSFLWVICHFVFMSREKKKGRSLVKGWGH